MWGYLNKERNYNLNTCRYPMESFDINALSLTGLLVHKKEERTVVAEFIDNDGWLDEGKEELGITNQEMVKNSTVQMDLQGTWEGLEEIPHKYNTIGNTKRDARSRATNTVDGARVGNSAQQSTVPAKMAQNHKKRALKSAILVRENAELRLKAKKKIQAEMQGMKEAMSSGAIIGTGKEAQKTGPRGKPNISG